MSGLAAIAGVVTRVEGSGSYIKTRYYLPEGTSLTYNILTLNPRTECLIFGAGGSLLQAASATSVLTIGVSITQFGATYSHQSEAIIFQGNQGNAYEVNQGFKVTRGTLNWHSGIIRIQEGAGFGAINFNNGNQAGTLLGRIGPGATLEVMATPSGQVNESCQIQFACAASFVVDGLVVRGYGTTPPTFLISLASTTQYTTPFAFNLQGGGGITAQANGRTTNFANFYGLKSTACPKDFNLFQGSLIRGVNQILGSSTIVVEHNPNTGHPQGYVELRNEVDATFLNLAGASQQGIVVYCRDTNNGKRQTYNLNGVVINNTADKVYLAASDAAGNVKFSGLTGSVLLAAVVRNTAGTVVGLDDVGLNAKDYRSLSGTKGTDDFRFYYWGYGFLPQDSVEILKSDNVAKFLAKTLLADANVTLSEAAAVAKLASSFTVAGNVLTVTTSSTLDDVYDALKAYKTRPVQAQVEYPTIGSQPVTGVGTQLNTAMSIVVNAGVTLTSGVKFKTISCAGVTVLGTITAIAVVGNVTQATPTALTGVSITGTLTYNTATTGQVTFTNSTLGSVANSGAGIVTIKRINSTLTPGTNVVAYLPTTLAFTLNGGRIRVLDHLGVEQYNQTTDGTFELPVSATGTWSYKIAKYGSKAIEGTLAINGTTIALTPAYIPDPVVFDTLANVSAYTALETTQKIYDYYSFHLASATGILLTKTVTLGVALLDLGAYNLTGGSIAVSATTIATGSSTLSGINVTTTGSISGIGPAYPQQLASAAGTTNWLRIAPTTGQVYLDSVNSTYSATASTTLLPASFTSPITIYVTRRGYKKQVVTVPYSTALLATQAFVLIPDTNVLDLVSDLSAANLATSQLIYDAFSQYQASAAGITDTYTPAKSPGAIDFFAKGFSLLGATDLSTSPLQIQSTGLVSDTYYSASTFTQGAATVANSVLIRASNLDSEIVFTPDSLTFYPSQSARDTGATPGQTVTGGVYRFLHGSTVSGVVMSGTVYVRVSVGTLVFFLDVVLVAGANIVDLGVQGQLTALNGKMGALPGLVWSEPLDTSIPAKKLLVTTASALAGKATGGGSETIVLRNLSDTADALTMTVDVNGNRSSVTLAP